MSVTSSWQRKCAITIDHTQVPGDLTNFPVMLIWTGSGATSNFPDEPLDSDGSYPAKSAGEDIRFCTDAAGTTEIPFEIVVWTQNANTASARALIYVKVPSVSSSTDTTIYVFYGNSSASAYATTDTYGRNNVWSDYQSVTHFQDDCPPVDATGSGTWSVYYGSVRSTTTPTSVGYSRYHSSDPPSTTTITFAADWSPAPSTYAISLSLRKTGTNWSGSTDLLRTRDNSDNDVDGLRYNTTATANTIGTGTDGVVATASSGSIASNTWYRVATAVNATPQVTLYINGSSAAGPAADDAPSSSWRKCFWGDDDLSYSQEMYLGDVFLHKSNRDSYWWTAEYNSFHDAGDFANAGTPESNAASPGRYGFDRIIMRKAFGAA